MMYNNNNNNGYGNGYGYNNNYNYNNNGYDQVRETLNKLQLLVIAADSGDITPDEVLEGVEHLSKQGRIKIAGRGTNRIAVEVVGDMTPYISFRADCIIKVPYTTQKALEDNNRERILIEYLRRMYNQTGDHDIAELINVLPAICSVRDFPALVAQEKVIPIERSQFVKAQYGMVADECVKVLLGQYKNECVRINELMDRYTVSCDINPVVTPFQYGFRYSNGRHYLTLLDTGYVIPKFTEMGNLIGSAVEYRKQLIIGKDIDVEIKDNQMVFRSLRRDIPESFLNIIKVALKKSGLYFVDPIPTDKPASEVFTNDMTYFSRVYDVARVHARSNPNTGMGQYFELIKLSKLSIYG